MFTQARTAGDFTGQERRRHLVFRTRNTEYHLRGMRCVAVRDPRTDRYIENHPALGRYLSGALRYGPGGTITKYLMIGEAPDVGDVLFFSDGHMRTELRTTAVCNIERPPKEAVSHYLH